MRIANAWSPAAGGLLGRRLGQRGVQSCSQVSRQRRKRRELVDRYVDGPVHRSMVTGDFLTAAQGEVRSEVLAGGI
ncbi:hypothetical protein EN20_13955 [Mycobacterium tuberculosis]|nr:hypothetical protein EN20_13955 [Mycobacterium tuberculosis]